MIRIDKAMPGLSNSAKVINSCDVIAITKLSVGNNCQDLMNCIAITTRLTRTTQLL